MIKKSMMSFFPVKKICLLTALLMISSIAFAGFNIDMPTENEVIIDSTDFIYHSQEFNISYTGSGETLTVDTGDTNLPDTWSWEWCDDFLGVCHLPGWPATFDVEDGDEININYSVIMDTTAGSFSFYFKYTAPSITDSIRCDFDFTATNAAVNEDPSQKLLVRSYPNPFTNSTMISYNLPTFQQQNLSITIFNIQGKKVKELNSSPIASEVVWNGEDIAGNEVKNGIYFYKIESQNVNQVNKIIKIK